MPDKPDANEPDWIEDLYAEGQDEGPPAALDDTIRAAARSHGLTPWYRDPRRLTGLAAAASFVIVVLIGFYGQGPESEAPEQLRTTSDVAKTETSGRLRRDLPAAAPAAPAGERQPAAASRTQTADTADLGTSQLAERPGAPTAEIEEIVVTANVPDDRPAEEEIPADREAASEPLASAISQRYAPGTASSLDTLAVTALKESDHAAIEARLEGECGALPGTAENRSLGEDDLGLYLIVTDAEGSRYFRCGQDPTNASETPVWFEIADPTAPPSEEQ